VGYPSDTYKRQANLQHAYVKR
jgi:hypothetical protein